VPLILAIETATKLCSVALARDGVVLAQRDLESEKHIHAEKVNVFIAEVMEEAGLPLTSLNAVAVGIGPGSYTGLRIGLSAAKGLCYGLDIPIIGLSTLGTLLSAARAAHAGAGAWWPMIDARRMEVFTQPHDAYGHSMAPATPLVIDAHWVDSAGECIVFGDGADKATEFWSVSSAITHLPGIRPHARAMVQEATHRAAQNQFDDLAYLVPDYGKPANVTQPKKRV